MKRRLILITAVFCFILFTFSIDFEAESERFFPVRFPGILTILFSGISAYLFSECKRFSRNECCLSILYAFFILVGRAFVKYYWNEWNAHLNVVNLIRWMVAYAGYYISILSVVHFVFSTIQKKQQMWVCIERGNTLIDQFPFVFSFLLLLILHLPAIILCFPGIPNEVDTGIQINMAFLRNEQGKLELANNHPIAHTLFMGGCIRLGIILFASETVGMGIYYLFQVIFSLVCYSIGIAFLTELGVNCWIRVGIVLFLGMNPALSNWLTCLTKDILFTDMILLFVIAIARFMMSKGSFACIILSGLGAMLMRNEGILVVIAGLIGLMSIPRYRKNAIKGMATFVFIYLGINRLLYPFLEIAPGSLAEPISLPIQMVSRYVIGHEEELTDKEKEVIASIINYDAVAEFYDHNSVDSIKYISPRFPLSEDVKQFLLLWIKLGIRHPLTYIDAFLDMKDQLMYPSRITGMYSYACNRIVSEVTVHDYKYAEQSGLHIMFPHVFDSMRQTFEDFRTYLQMQPCIMPICISTTYVWISLGMVFFFTGTHNRTLYPYMFIPLLLVISMFLGPRDGDYFRYAYPLACILPYCFMIALAQNNIKDD